MKNKIITKLSSILLIIVIYICIINSNTVYAAGNLSDCGDNLGTSYSEGGHYISIWVKDKTKSIEENVMSKDFGAASAPWDDYRDNVYGITIHNNVNNISVCAFEYMSNVKTIYIPASVKSIGKYAFRNCDSLTTVYYGGTKEELEILKDNTDNLNSGNSSFLNAEFICMDKGDIIINLPDDN